MVGEVHCVFPAAVMNFPGEHSTHEPPSGPEKPMSQMQSVDFTLPTGELEPEGQEVGAVAPFVSQYFPASQSVQPFDPAAVLNFPVTHSVHDFACPVYPELQRQRELAGLLV